MKMYFNIQLTPFWRCEGLRLARLLAISNPAFESDSIHCLRTCVEDVYADANLMLETDLSPILRSSLHSSLTRHCKIRNALLSNPVVNDSPKVISSIASPSGKPTAGRKEGDNNMHFDLRSRETPSTDLSDTLASMFQHCLRFDSSGCKLRQTIIIQPKLSFRYSMNELRILTFGSLCRRLRDMN